jgi:hypothetical protein
MTNTHNSLSYRIESLIGISKQTAFSLGWSADLFTHEIDMFLLSHILIHLWSKIIRYVHLFAHVYAI